MVNLRMVILIAKACALPGTITKLMRLSVYLSFKVSNAASLRNFCRSLGLSIVHNCKPTHFDLAHGSSSLIDFCLVSNALSVGFSSQGQCPGVSHHALIFGTIEIPVVVEEKVIEFLDFNRADWLGIGNLLCNFDFSPLYNTSDVDHQLALIDLLFQNLFSFVPVVSRRVNPKNDAWLDLDVVKSSRSMRDLAYFEWRRRPTDGNRRIYCMYRNRCKAVMRNERRKFYETMFGRMNDSQLWKSLKSFGCLDDGDEVPFIDVNAVNDYFCGVSNSSLMVNRRVDETNVEDSFRFYCVYIEDVVSALRKVKSGAVGVDGLPIKFFRCVFPYICGHFLHFINTIFMTSTFPQAWKVARVVPVPKKGGSYNHTNLRPISILPSMSKIVEHIVKNAIVEFIDDRKCLSSSQYGFRHGHSSTLHLLCLTDLIRDVFNGSDVGLLVGLDLSKAFDSVDHGLLLHKLRHKFGFSLSTCMLISSYLVGRSQFVEHRGVRSDVSDVRRGVPQGSVLGPLLFIMFIDDIVDSIAGSGCSIFMYADDIHVFFRSVNLLNLENLANSVLQSLSLWISSNGLAINWDKTEAVVFNTPVNSVIPNICLRRLYSLQVYLPLNVRRKVAMSLLMSHVNYCLEVVSGASSSQMLRVHKIFNSIVRYVFGLRRGDHVSQFVVKFLGLSFDKCSQILESEGRILIGRMLSTEQQPLVLGMGTTRATFHAVGNTDVVNIVL
ncbi:uncharacterized protein [Musca autumnalis]|uniref:uncharacterized protein n=1 Tax=Musca autumnalis TaxID=221902 RepID=UPI003CE93FA0